MRRLVVSVLMWLGLAAAVWPAGAVASANLDWRPGVNAVLPSGAGTSPAVNLNSVSCASAGNCVAVGSYNDGSGHEQGVLLTESSGIWGAGTQATLPASVATNPVVSLNSVSCASPGNCTAVGSYNDGSGHGQGLLLTESSGVWGTGLEAPLPLNAATNPVASLASVSCTSAGNCTAVGQYSDGSGSPQGLLLTESSGTWSAGIEATLPAGASATPIVYLNSVSCVSAGNCYAVGEYGDNSFDQQGVLLTESSGVWAQGVEAPLPSNAATASSPGVVVASVSCAPTGTCAAVGWYYTSSSLQEGMMLNEGSGAWSTGVEAALPVGASHTAPSVNLNWVSCVSHGNCTAVGEYTDGSSNQQGLLLSAGSRVWSKGVEAKLPANAGSSHGVLLNSTSCASAGNCAAVGEYTNSSSVQQGLLLTERSGVWATGVEARLPGGSAANPQAYVTSVSCASPRDCTAVGRHYDASFDQLGLLLGAAPASPTLSVTAPRTDTAKRRIAASDVAAKLSGGSAPAVRITFRVIGPRSSAPTSCGPGGTTVGTANASGNGTYHPSAGFTPQAAGDYWWFASAGGDAGNNPAVSKCGPGMAKTVVRSAPAQTR